MTTQDQAQTFDTVELARVGPGSSVLDVGGGYGETSHASPGIEADVTAIYTQAMENSIRKEDRPEERQATPQVTGQTD